MGVLYSITLRAEGAEHKMETVKIQLVAENQVQAIALAKQQTAGVGMKIFKIEEIHKMQENRALPDAIGKESKPTDWEQTELTPVLE